MVSASGIKQLFGRYNWCYGETAGCHAYAMEDLGYEATGKMGFSTQACSPLIAVSLILTLSGGRSMTTSPLFYAVRLLRNDH
jgi:hypothetical protein